MTTLIDARFNALRSLGYTGAVTDMVYAWERDNAGVIDSGWYATLDSLAPPGIGRHINDLENWFWSDGGTALYDYVIDATLGNDSNDGLTPATAWKTLSKINNLNGLNTRHSILVKTGIYSSADDFIEVTGNVGGGTEYVVHFESGTIMDGTAAVAAVASQDAVEVKNANGAKLTVYGNGLLVRNYAEGTALSPNGFSSRDDTTLTVYDANVDNCDDGFSAHGDSTMVLWRCTAQNAEKSPFVHVGNTTVIANSCTFTESAGGNLNITDSSEDPDITLNDCALIPSFVSGGDTLRCGGATLNRCVVGTEANPVKLYATTNPVVLNDSYINAYADGNNDVVLSGCYGKFTLRVRNGGSLDMQNCVIVAPATGYSSVLYQSYDPGSGSPVVMNNNIFSGSFDFDNMISALADYVMDAVGTTFYNNLLFGGTAYSSTLVAADNGAQIAGTVTTDPNLGTATGTLKTNYGWLPGSPAQGAGFGGADIGFSA
jgi:hypothetical protein